MKKKIHLKAEREETQEISENIREGKYHTNVLTVLHIPEVFWLKLMALNAHDDSLMSINGFRINLKSKDKKRHFQISHATQGHFHCSTCAELTPHGGFIVKT